MKTFKFFTCSVLFAIVALGGLFVACDNEMQSVENSKQEKTEQADLEVLKSFAKYVTKEVYSKAYDKETGDIDIEKYDQIILSYKLNKPIDLSKSFEQPILSRGSNDIYDNIANSNQLTDRQKDFFNKLLTLKQPSLADYQALKIEASSWQTDEKILIIQSIDNIIAIINGIEEGLSDITGLQAIQTRRASSQSYMCNAGVSMISAVTGFLAGALTAPTGVGGFVGVIVSTAVGTYLGANMC